MAQKSTAKTASKTGTQEAPELAYQPIDPKDKSVPVGLIGCGEITKVHLTAYRDAGYQVVALCDVDLGRAKERQAEFYPKARVTKDYRELLEDRKIVALDIATHPLERSGLIEEALLAGKHVLSQKPFVFDLGLGQRLVDLAAMNQLVLAVNQNARYAPHLAYLREAVKAGLVGDVLSVHCSVHWDHNWILGTPFEQERHIILYDFAIHWFDFLTTVLPYKKARKVHASIARSSAQKARPALLGQALVEFEGAQASLVFDGDVRFGARDRTYIAGSKGTLISEGVDHQSQQVTLHNEDGTFTPQLEGSWFPGGFHGTMGEFLRSIEESREPEIAARANLDSLALCFAAVVSADRKEAIDPGSVRRMPGAIG